jgi:hypothetical protein
MGCERLFSNRVSCNRLTDITGLDDRARQNHPGLHGEQRSREPTGARRVQSRRARPCGFRGYVRGSGLEGGARPALSSLTLFLFLVGSDIVRGGKR